MRPGTPALYDESDALGIYAEEVEQASEDDLWFLPGPMDDEPDYLPPGPRAEPRETEVLDENLYLTGVPLAIGSDGESGIGADQERRAGLAGGP